MTPVESGSAGSAGPGGGPSDADLLVDVRGQPADAASSAAFGKLYDRHVDSARALARQLARSPADAEDLTSAAFARLLEVLRAGGGPTEAFRAYLLTSLRHLAYDRTRAERRLDLTEDIGDVVGVDPERTVVPFSDPAVAGLERSLAARAFATLPERWQAVLWHLEVEGDSPADVAPVFGLTPNAVSALGYRAREGLRQAYLQEHLASDAGAPPRDRRHRETSERLGAYTRGGLSKRDAERVETHLAECDECRALASELREVNSGMVRAAVGPTVLGAALVGYLATRGQGADLFASGPLPRLPTTGELAVAGGGVLGVLSAVGGMLRPDLLPRRAGRAVAAVGAVGLGAAGLTALALVGPTLGGAPPAAAPVGPLPVGPLLDPAVPAPPGGTAPVPPPAAAPVIPLDGDVGARGVGARDVGSGHGGSGDGAAGDVRSGAGRHRGTGTGTGGEGRHRADDAAGVTTTTTRTVTDATAGEDTTVTTRTVVTHRADGRETVRVSRVVRSVRPTVCAGSDAG